MSLSKPLLITVFVLCIYYPTEGAQPVPQPNATGHLQLKFTERSPDSSLDEVMRRTDMNPATTAVLNGGSKADWEYDLSKESFDVFVPPAYRADTPYGLLVWMGVTEASPEWMNVLARHRLIFVTPNNVGGRPVFIREGLAADAVLNLSKLYNIDPQRVYVCGFSGGAGAATNMLCGFADLFHGALLLMGGRFYESRKNETGQFEPTLDRLAPTWKGPLDQLKPDIRIVFMRGQLDPQYAPNEDRAQLASLLLDGFTHVAYIEVPGVGHNQPNAIWFEKGIIALDQTKPATPPTTAPTTQPHPSPGQLAQARRILATGQSRLDHESAKRAREWLQRVLDEFPTTPAAMIARVLMKKIDQNPGQ